MATSKTIRDFTNEAKKNLEAAIEKAGRHSGGLFYPGDRYQDWRTSGNRDNYKELQDYYNALMDKHNTSKGQLNAIWTAVYGVESNFVSQIKTELETVQALKTSFTNLANMLAPAAGGSIPLVALSSEEFNVNLAGAWNDIYENVKQRFASEDKDGNITYDFDAIDATLNQNAQAITQLEYLILAELYAGMNLKDTEEFLLRLADKIDDHDSGFFSADEPKEYTTWKYDPNKVANIQRYVDTLTSIETLEQMAIDNMSDEEIVALYNKEFPEESQESSIDEKRRKLVGKRDDGRRGYIQQSTFLTIVLGLADQETAKETSNSLPRESFETAILTGKKGADGPMISLEELEDSSEYKLTFCNRETTTLKGPDSVITGTNNLNENTILISDVLSGTRISGKIVDNAKVYYDTKYTFDSTGTATSNTGVFAKNEITSVTLGRISNYLLTRVTAKGVSKLIGFIPVVGDFANFGIDMNMDYEHEQAQQAHDYADITSTLESIKDTDYCKDFQLDAVVIYDGSASQQVIMSPSPETQNIVENLNRFAQEEYDDKNFEEVGAYLESFGLTITNGRITVQNVLEQSAAIQSLLDTMSSSDLAWVLNPRR
jgi:hypothetical protein